MVSSKYKLKKLNYLVPAAQHLHDNQVWGVWTCCMRLVPMIRYCPREWINTLTRQVYLIGPQISLEAYLSGKIKRITHWPDPSARDARRCLAGCARTFAALARLPLETCRSNCYSLGFIYGALASRRRPAIFTIEAPRPSSIQSPRSISRLPKSTGILPLITDE
jgi:hypothetical protein